MIKKVIFIISFILLKINNSFAVLDQTIKKGLIGGQTGSIITGVNNNKGLTSLDLIFKFIQDSLTSLISLIAIGVFLYIGIKLVMSRGNPEEFKKAMLHFVYAAIGIFVISASWAIVKLVGSLNV